MCLVHGCEKEVVAKGLCDMHYRRAKKHGTTEQSRPEDWGTREKHPLYGTWTWFRRSKTASMCEEWHKDFWAFVKDVSPKPDGTRLMREDNTLPLSKSNFKWEKALLTTKGPEGRNGYHKAHRVLRPDIYKKIDLKKYYGISLEEFWDMQEAQGNVCAICGNPEVDVDKKNGKVRDLAVDHDHSTGKIRDLLCRGCNQGLGNFKDNPETLEKAAKYIRRHNEL